MTKLDLYSENNCYWWTFRGLWAGFVIYDVSRVHGITLLLTKELRLDSGLAGYWALILS